MYESMYNYVGTFYSIAVFFGSFAFPGLSLAFLPMFGCCSSWLLLLGKINSRMMRGGSSTQACEEVPVRRSARQAGHSPESYPQPPLRLPNPPSTQQIMRMFEERRNNDLIELLKSVQAMVGQNGNQNGHNSKLSDF